MPFLNNEGLEVVKEIIESKYAGKNADGAVVSVGADYAEYGDWADGNPDGENRTGYFVTIAPNSNDIQIANSTSAITGVTTDSAGFIGNYSKGAEADASKGLVGIVGQISVIDKGSCAVGERCMPGDGGTAVPSSNNCGYLVIDRVDATHVRILVAPTIDMIQRIKTDMVEVEGALDGKSDSGHEHDSSDITSGTLDAARIPNLNASKITAGALPITRGGTGATSAADARAALGVGTIGTKDSLAAADIPNLSTAKLTSGTLGIARGGTGATTAAGILTNLSITDKVEASGTSGVWTYQKYTSGLAVLYASGTVANLTFGAWGSVYDAQFFSATNYPFTFKTAPVIIGRVEDVTMISEVTGTTSKSQCPNLFAASAVSVAAKTNKQYGVLVVGRWK